jgi:hypothetical protein
VDLEAELEAIERALGAPGLGLELRIVDSADPEQDDEPTMPWPGWENAPVKGLELRIVDPPIYEVPPLPVRPARPAPTTAPAAVLPFARPGGA